MTRFSNVLREVLEDFLDRAESAREVIDDFVNRLSGYGNGSNDIEMGIVQGVRCPRFSARS